MTQNGTAKNGMTQNGTTKNGMTQNGTTKNGMKKNGTIPNLLPPTRLNMKQRINVMKKINGF